MRSYRALQKLRSDCTTPERSLSCESCSMLVWPSLNFEPALTFEPVPEATSQQDSSGQSTSFQYVLQALQVFGKCLSHSPSGHNPENSWGYHNSCKPLLFPSKILPAQMLLPTDFHCIHLSFPLHKEFGWSWLLILCLSVSLSHCGWQLNFMHL